MANDLLNPTLERVKDLQPIRIGDLTPSQFTALDQFMERTHALTLREMFAHDTLEKVDVTAFIVTILEAAVDLKGLADRI